MPDGAERQFEITCGDIMAECFASDLKTLKEECAAGLQLKEDSFNITYQVNGKTVTVKTEGNFKMMLKRQPNAEGNFEVTCVLKEVAVEPQIEIPPYKPSGWKLGEEVAQEVEDHLNPFYEELRRLGVLKEGMKTITDRNDDTYDVYGTLYNGELMGRGEYTDKNGTVTKAHFYKDVQYGRIIATQAKDGVLQVANMWNGRMHGHATFYDGPNYPYHTNCMVDEGNIHMRGDRKYYEDDRSAFFKKDGKAFRALAFNWRAFC